jgi:sarcosine oxidase gamma subunit
LCATLPNTEVCDVDARKIFISYRRADARADAGRLYDRLDARYPGRVFRDVGSLDPGVEWQDAIEHVLASTDAFIVVIGPGWLTAADPNGTRRIDDPQDPVRKEIASALRNGTRVYPVLVGGARPPADAELPDEVRPLLRHNALELSEQDFDAGVNKLVKAIERTPGWAPTGSTRSSATRIAAVLALIAALAGIYAVRQRINAPSPTSTTTPGPPADPSSSAPPDRSDSAAGGAGNATSSVGQITFTWNGANAVSWQVMDANKRTVVRYASVAAGQSETLDVGPGNYFVVLDNKPEIQPVAVAVTAGHKSGVTTSVGQIAFTWNGANPVTWQVLDASKRKVIRFASAGAGQTEVLDLGPGDYVVALDGKPEIKPVAVTVTAGREARVSLPSPGR